MLPVCSATTSSSSHYQISFQVGPRTFFPLHKSIVEERVTFGRLNGIHSPEVSFKTHATKLLYAHVLERSNEPGSRELANISPNQNQFDDIVCGISDDSLEREPQKWRDINGPYPVSDDLHYVETPSISGLDESDSTEVFSNNSYGQSSEGMAVEPLTSSNAELQSDVSPSRGEFPELSDQLTLSTNVPDSAASESLSTADTGIVMEKATSASDTLDATNDAMSKLKGNLDNFLSGINKSMDTSIGNADTALKNSYDSVTSSFTNAVRSATKSFENAASDVLSSFDNTGDLAGNKLSGLTSDFKENTYKLGNVAINVLRQTIVMVEDSLANAGSFIVYSYGSTKELLPPELQDVLNTSEERAMQVLRPIGTAFQQVYIGIEELEKYLGFDPNDPIVPFILFLGSSATLGISYWAFTYGGYSGDLSPKSTLDLLSKEENVVLIDVRPEDLRERDGIPDLRRGARFKYTNITLPEMDGSLRKLLKKGREIDDALVAVVIRNLKIVRDRSKVIVMDASGARSKGIARSLRKLGVMKPYLVQGGYRAWMKNGLRVKELKPETTLTILNEEAEAILEEIRPTPLKIIGYGAGFIASIYALQNTAEQQLRSQIISILPHQSIRAVHSCNSMAASISTVGTVNRIPLSLHSSSSGASVPSSAFLGSNLKKVNSGLVQPRASNGGFKVVAEVDEDKQTNKDKWKGLAYDTSDDQQDITRGKGMVDSLFQAPMDTGTHFAVMSSYEYLSTGLRQYSLDNMKDGFYIAPAFMDKLIVHITKNFMTLPNIKVPLILGIWGGKGQGKSFQCELVFAKMGINPIMMSAGELESGNAGEPAKLIRQRYREASDIIRKGKMCCLFINDLDAGAGRMGGTTQYTVNNQMVNATLMNIADSPTNVQLPGMYNKEENCRVPIIVTGNDFSTLYAPLIRDGRMEKFYWAPTREDRIGVCTGIFRADNVPKDDIVKLVDTFPGQSIDFFGALRARVYDDEVRKWIEGVGVEQVGKRLVNSKEGPPTFEQPAMTLEKLLEYGNMLVQEQENVKRVQLADKYMSEAALGEANEDAIKSGTFFS